METIAIINRKGGVGKTATAQALGAGLAAKGKKVLYVDLDSQTNLSYVLGADTEQQSSMDLLLHETTAKQAIQHTPQGDIIAGSEDLAAADTQITENRKEYRLKEALEELTPLYDYVIIDTPAALGTLTINALTASQSAIVTVQPDAFSLQGLGQLNKAIETVKKYCNHDLQIKGILLTRFTYRPVLSRDMLSNMEDAAEQLNTFVYEKPIRECISVKEAQASQQDIFTYAPRSNAAIDYKAFIDEFLARR